jgi:glycosyltransferase involved in cell wall biosynthesis
MKILSVYTSIPSDDAAWWRISNITNLLRSKGHEVHIVHYIRKPSLAKLLSSDNYGDGTFVVSSASTVHLNHIKFLFKEKYDIVYGNTHSSAFCSLLGKLIGVPVIFDMHGGLVEEYLLENETLREQEFLKKYIYKSFVSYANLKLSNKIVCVSKNMISYLHNEKGVPLKKMAYITNGVNLEFFKTCNNSVSDRLRRELGIDKKLVFGYIGGFQKWQGVEDFIVAAKRIQDNDIAFLIIGDKAKRLNNMLFIPKVPRSQIPLYYSIIDIFVLPRPNHLATQIAAPTKFAEYSAMSKPVLATDVGDAADLIRTYNSGLVIKDNQRHNLIKGICELKEKSNEELEVLGNNSRRLAKDEFNWDQIGINLSNALESI